MALLYLGVPNLGARQITRPQRAQTLTQVVLAKAGRNPVVAAAESKERRLTDATARAFERVALAVPLSDMQDAIRSGGGALWTLLDVENRTTEALRGVGAASNEDTFQEILHNTAQAGAMAGLSLLDKIPVAKARLSALIVFDLVNPQTLKFLSSYVFDLITGIARETADAIRNVITRAVREGGHPYEQARDIRSMVGLTTRQSVALQNYRRMLESGDPTLMRESLERALRDHRFDGSVLRAIQERSRLPQEKIDALVQRYRDRLLQHRARMIARTETLRSANLGQQMLWQQGVAQGRLSTAMRKYWIITPDERLCDRCKKEKRDNANGVAVDGLFQTDAGPLMMPPLHPNCRCTAGIR